MAQQSWLGNIWDAITGREEEPAGNGILNYQPEIKPAEDQGILSFLGPVGRTLQQAPAELPASFVPSDPRYTPGLSESQFIYNQFLGEPIAKIGEGLEGVAQGFGFARQKEMGSLIPELTQSGKQVVGGSLEFAPVGGPSTMAARKGLLRGAEAVERSPVGQGILAMQEQRGMPISRMAETQPTAVQPILPAYKEPRITAQPDPETGLYSNLEEQLLNLRQEINTPRDIERYLTKRGVNRGEMEDVGLLGELRRASEAGERVTKQGLLDFVQENRPRMEVMTNEFTGTPEDIDRFRISYDQGTPIEDYDYVMSRADDYTYEVFGGTDDLWANGLRDEIAEFAAEKMPELRGNIPAQNALKEEIKNTSNFSSLDPDKQDIVREWAERRAQAEYDENPYMEWDVEGYQVWGSDDVGYSIRDPNGNPIGDNIYSIDEVNVQIQQDAMDRGYVGIDGDTRWHEYTMGRIPVEDLNAYDYEEVLIKSETIGRGSDEFVNNPHFDEPDVLAHLRTTERDFFDDQGRHSITFIEELQSDWHQKGRQSGYADRPQAEINREIADLGERYKFQEGFQNEAEDLILKEAANNPAYEQKLEELGKILVGNTNLTPDAKSTVNRLRAAIRKKADGDAKPYELQAINMAAQDKNLAAFIQRTEGLIDITNKRSMLNSLVPDAPLKGDRWIELGLKEAIVKAAREGKEGVAWTPAQQQVEQWSERYRELYENLYDKKLPSMAKKIANEYGLELKKVKVDGVEVPYLELNSKARERIKERGMKLPAVAPAIPGAGLLADQEDKGENRPMRSLMDF